MRKKSIRIISLVLCLCMALMLLAGCGGGTSKSGTKKESAPEIDGLKYESEVKVDYATHFHIYKYEGGYSLIKIKDSGDQFLVVPKGKKAPEGLSSKITVLKKPVKNIYLAATACMAMFKSMDALDSVRMTSIKADEWSVPEAKKLMKQGKIIYAGKYDQPDYELILKNKCDLTVESTMITHSPETKEMIEDLKIPVLVDYSSFESDPLGRTEWIKVYGVITGHEKQAEAFFEKQKKIINKIKQYKSTGKTVAFFYISSDGKAVVRRSSDYIPTMIKLAGGEYVFKDLGNTSHSTSVPMSMEKFYETAKDADFIVYNGSIDGTVKTKEALIAKNSLLKKFKA
ncbi:MAG: ABC transporter substrate-binding protein, partial [Anaerovoracaceae bacterium]